MLLVSLVPRLYLFATRSFKQRFKIDVTTRGSQLVTKQKTSCRIILLNQNNSNNLSFGSTNMAAKMLYATEAVGEWRISQLSTTEAMWEPVYQTVFSLSAAVRVTTWGQPPQALCYDLYTNLQFDPPLPLATVFVLSPDGVRFYPSRPGRWSDLWSSVNRLGWFISMDVPLPVVDGTNKNQ